MAGIDKGGCAAALGTFDGLHLGHMALIDELIKNANGRLTMVCTYSNIPAAIFGKDVKQLFTPEEKEEYISSAGIDVLFMRKFDKAFSSMSKDKFISELIDELGCKLLVVGYNYRFGKGGEGTAEYLREETAKRGVRTIIIPPVQLGDAPVNSTLIRTALKEGDIKKANELLGHTYTAKGLVVRGKQLGRKIGFPTANISLPENKCLPDNGVYAVYAYVNGHKYRGMTNIGIRPTVDNSGSISVETYIDSFSEDIYGKKLRIEFIERIRPERKMESEAELKAQLEQDIQTVRDILA